MDISAIRSVIQSGHKGTRIPEELLGLPPRSARYERAYLSMDAIPPVSASVRRPGDTLQSSPDVSGASAAGASSQAVNAAADTASVNGDTFRKILSEAIEAQTASDSGARSLLSDPAHIRELMTLGSLSGRLISAGLTQNTPLTLPLPQAVQAASPGPHA